MNAPNITLVGATGAVGQELLNLIEERRFPFGRLSLVASSRSAGREISFAGRSYPVEDLERFDFSATDIAFFSAGTKVSKEWAKRATGQGALVIDNTNAFRMDPESPLVVPQVNGDRLNERPANGIIANPNCSTIQMVRVLRPILRRFGISQVVVSTYQAASGGGLTGIAELLSDAQAMIDRQPSPEAKRFPAPLAFNVVPQVDVVLPTGFTLEEQKMVQESRKILETPDLRLTATAVRVPVMNGHSEAVYVECEREVDREELLQVLSDGPEMKVYGSLDAGDWPTPRFLNNSNEVHVGRIRINPDNRRGVWFWIVANNLRIGAALNALQIAEEILARRWF